MFDWMTMKAPPISPYSEHPFKARQVLGTTEQLSIQDRTSPGLQGNVQYLREVEHLRDLQRSGQQSKSRSWSGESGLDCHSPDQDSVSAEKEENGETSNEQDKTKSFVQQEERVSSYLDISYISFAPFSSIWCLIQTPRSPNL